MRGKLGKLAAVCTVAASIIAISVTSASAATNSLTVTTLGRNGVAVSTSVNVTGLSHGIATGSTYTVRSGKALALPAGTYAVLVDIWNPADSTDTLAGSVVAVSGAKSVTLDARQGKALQVSLDTSPGAGYRQSFDARICAGGMTSGSVAAYGAPGSFFVIPNSSTSLQFGYMSVWENSVNTDAYAVSGETTGLPGALNKVFPRSSLATWNATVRRGPAGSPWNDLALQPVTANVTCSDELFHELNSAFSPYALSAHVSPGTWSLRSDTFAMNGAISGYDIGSWYRERTVTAGATYSQTFYGSTWGPTFSLPYVWRNTLWFDTSWLFNDPSVSGSECCEETTATLSFGGKVIATQHRYDYGGTSQLFSAKLTSTGWYTFDLTNEREYPGIIYLPGTLSGSGTVRFHFRAGPAAAQLAPVYLTRFVPNGLNAYNQAAPNSTTTVSLIPDRQSQSPDIPTPSLAITSIKAWASYDYGVTWHAVTVTHAGTKWTAAVPNPAVGKVSLRATITNANGDTTVTILKAYGIA